VGKTSTPTTLMGFIFSDRNSLRSGWVAVKGRWRTDSSSNESSVRLCLQRRIYVPSIAAGVSLPKTRSWEKKVRYGSRGERIALVLAP
jgi:hypothetical protein